MIWPWRTHQRQRDSVAEAERHRERVEQQQPAVEKLARELARRQQANQFSEAVRRAFGGQ